MLFHVCSRHRKATCIDQQNGLINTNELRSRRQKSPTFQRMLLDHSYSSPTFFNASSACCSCSCKIFWRRSSFRFLIRLHEVCCSCGDSWSQLLIRRVVPSTLSMIGPNSSKLMVSPNFKDGSLLSGSAAGKRGTVLLSFAERFEPSPAGADAAKAAACEFLLEAPPPLMVANKKQRMWTRHKLLRDLAAIMVIR